MRLWTFQALPAIQVLQHRGALTVHWNQYSKRDPFLGAYRWMAAQMQQRRLPLNGGAPLWAWHSCGGYGRGPSLDVAGNLLSLAQIEAGMKTVELECPDDLVLLSSYHYWNDVIDHFIDHPEVKEPPLRLTSRLFRTDADFAAGDHLQACLPFLSMDWVVDIRDLPLPASDDIPFDREALC